ncbi:MAG: CarD family transcriptional regulator [Acidobacteriota bacterium]|nr:CarD family transcriptional regulator [Acidobacteriota bacterium]
MDLLKVGDKIIYPAQGLGIIEEISEETFDGQSSRILHIRLADTNTLVVIPSSSASEIGLRRPISQKQVNRFFQFFKACPVDISTDWKDRYKENFDLMKSGQLKDLAIVYKTLYLLSRAKPLSFREKKMLEKARVLIVSELSASSLSCPKKISQRLDHILADNLKELKSGREF